MSVAFTKAAAIASSTQPLGLSQLLQVSSASANPAYLVLNAFDRNEYTASASGATGSFAGLTSTQGLTTARGDAREAGIVFQYQAATGRYVNTTFGFLDQLSYIPSASAADVTDLSLFGTSNASLAYSYADDAIRLAVIDAAGYLGTLTVATQPGVAVPQQATPGSIAAIAQSFVGAAWNMDGCWTLASTIAAEAGASLPVQSTANLPGQANGEWFAAFNGPAGSSGDWTAQVRAGDVIGFVTGAGGGHITTCVSGSGASARLVDNITYTDGSGRVLNAANDGSANDVVIAAPHLASQEWSGVQASSVVIFRLDAPVVTAGAALSLPSGSSTSLASSCTAVDPAGASVSRFQLYLQSGADTLSVDGAAVAASSAASAVTVSSLARASLLAGTAGSADTLVVRAGNGLYWGDWTTLAVQATAPAASPAQRTQMTLPTAAAGPSALPVFRFFDSSNGTHFFTASAGERDGLLATRHDLDYEGVGLTALASPGSDAAAEPVFRFFNKVDGTHFFTASAAERDGLVANRTDMTLEGTAFYADAAAQPGDTAVYRFFDTAHGTHLFTASEAERASILSGRPDLVPEGIAFFAPA